MRLVGTPWPWATKSNVFFRNVDVLRVADGQSSESGSGPVRVGASPVHHAVTRGFLQKAALQRAGFAGC